MRAFFRYLLVIDPREEAQGAARIHTYPPRVEASEGDAARVVAALRAFGAPLMGLTEKDLIAPGLGLRIGVEPGRVGVLNKVSGIAFPAASAGRIEASFGDVRAHAIGLVELLANKRAAGRPQDLADVDALERLRRARERGQDPV